MANKAKGANFLNKRYQLFWKNERSKLDEPWRIPNSDFKGWKDRIRKDRARRGRRPKELANG